ncbi:tRNA-specific adenosine deaminase 1 [Galleria mellonella]|uniref:tRNA-specific adenosine deaminase 1 n=1 Tax=Galleria mellonella TaxID=7137 RepID=A0A6J1WLQ9_GALME|nr:tRNA-specific adenosine deaminase 1 [Galleria mellonella]
MSNLQNTSKTFVDKIVQHCLNLYNKLPKTGKPTEDEWTVLSCVVQHDTENDTFDVVSLGTGSKCIGSSKLSPSGDLLNDSHAEVFARRGFLLYLYDNIDSAIENKQSIFIQENGRFRLKSNISFIFYSSQLPCGDGSIFSKNADEECFGDILSKKREAQGNVCDGIIKKQKLESDIYRTGAKCLPDSEQDPKEAGRNYHLVAQVRTKPGRGDRTLSVSCSDKIAKWIHLGIQGRLLDMCLINPIYISSFIFGGGVPYSEESLKRAFLHRNSVSDLLIKYTPKFYQSSVIFHHIKTEHRLRPASGSIVWIKSENQTLEVAVQGKKLGVTKKAAKSLTKSLCISKYNIYQRFQNHLHKNKMIKENIFNNDPVDIPYNQMKAKATRYEKSWLNVKQKLFKTWTVKPDIWNFCVST